VNTPPGLRKVWDRLQAPGGCRWLRTASLTLTAMYLAGLLLAIAGMRLWGEQHWLTTALLYAPRMAFLLPLPLAVLGLALFGPRRLLWAMPLALWLALFPLMGLELGLGRSLGGGARAGHPDEPSLRILSYNVAGGQAAAQIAAVVREARPDVLLIQEWKDQLEPALRPVVEGFHRHQLGQFWVASRYPIEDVYVPPVIHVPDQAARSSRFVRYRLATPLGPLHVLNVHPVSPREDLVNAASLEATSRLRRRQAENIASEAGRSPVPVIIAGDTNLPLGSWIMRQTLGRYRDGFEAAGRGFGYTFPAARPWMRIDRILGDQRIRFLRFQVLGNSRASDHLAVSADVIVAR
jgi:vancomycin resistance protein VanJ